MMEYASNGNESDPTAFVAHAKKKNHGIKTMVERGPKEGREDVTLVTSLVTMQKSALIEGTLPRMMTTTTQEGMAITRTTSSKEKGRIPLIVVEMGKLSRGQEITGMMSLMLLIIREMNLFLYLPSL